STPPSPTVSPRLLTTQACCSGQYWTSAIAAPAGGACADVNVTRVSNVDDIVAVLRRSNAESGDQPSGNNSGSPWAESGVSWNRVSGPTTPPGTVTTTTGSTGVVAPLDALDAVESVPPSAPIVTAAASGVSRASTGTVPP